MLSGQDLRGSILQEEHHEDPIFDRLGQRPPPESVRSSCRAENQHGAPRALLEPIIYCRFKIGGAGTIVSTFALTLGVALHLRHGTTDASRPRGSHDIGAVPEFLAPTVARRHLCGAVMAMSHRWLRRPVRSGSALRGEQGSVTIGMGWMISLNGRA